MSQTRYLTFARQLLSNLRTNFNTMARNGTSLSATTQLNKETQEPPKLSQYQGLEHLPAYGEGLPIKCVVKSLDIKVEDGPDGTVAAFLHIPEHQETNPTMNADTAAILLSGAGGGVVGPSSMYISIADKLASLRKGIPVMRLDYRYPARNKYCVPDVLAAMKFLERNVSVSRFVLVGWSFGGAPTFTVGGMDDRVVGCATVASQTAETEGIKNVGKRGIPLLLLHGTGDRTLSPSCSQRLYDMYGEKGKRKIELFPGDDHALTGNSLKAEEMLAEFIMSCAGVQISDDEQENIVQKSLVDGKQKIEKMQQGGDLRGGESVE